jgi:hypothetical protein
MKTTLKTYCRAALPIAATLALFVTTSLARDYYVLPSGAGSKNGSSWANAYAWSDSSFNSGNILNTVMKPGDRLLMGSGTYGSGKTIFLTSSGTSSARKTVEGVDRGGGLPIIDGGSWSRTNPSSGSWTAISIQPSGPDYWTIKNLILQDVQHGIYADSNMTTQAVGLQFVDITIRNVRYGAYVRSIDSGLFRRVEVRKYTKHGFRLEGECDNVTIEDCVGDMSDGDTTWYDHSENFPYGYILENVDGPNTNISFFDCAARNHRKNGQPSSGYWNGDGFVVEGSNTGISFDKCRAYNNEDGGFDLKPDVYLKNCVAVSNKRNFRLWSSTPVLDNCVASFTTKRGGSGGRNGFWIDNAAATLNYCTGHDTDGVLISEEGSGSVTVNFSVLTFTGSNGTIRTGSGVENSTHRYRPGFGTNPNYLSPSSTWGGVGTNMNSQTYGTTRGYSSNANGTSR